MPSEKTLWTANPPTLNLNSFLRNTGTTHIYGHPLLENLQLLMYESNMLCPILFFTLIK